VREQQQRRGELVERVDAHHPVAIEQRAVGRVVSRECAGMGAGHRGSVGGAAGLEHDHRDLAPRGLGERSLEAFGVADRFDEEPNDPRRCAAERPVEIIARARHEFAPARHAEVELQAPVVERERAVDGTRLRDPSDRSDLLAGVARERGDAQADLLVDESHAIAAAERDARFTGHRRDSLRERGLAVGFQVTARKDRRGACAVADRVGERGFDLLARNADRDVVDDLRDVVE